MATEVQYLEDLSIAEKGSFYTICGAGGPLDEWVEGLTEELVKAGVGTPEAWYKTTGAAVNYYVKPRRPSDAFPSDLVILMFSLDGLNVGPLAMVKIMMADRWFDDLIQNIRRRNEEEG